MKKKQTEKPYTPEKKRGIKWNEVSITALAIMAIGGWFIWMVVHIYQQEGHESEMQEAYIASLPPPGVSIDHKLVCMVNNRYMGSDQIPVPIQDKTDYGCSDKCVRDLNTDETVRFAVDPYSKQTVDKALAFITMSSAKPGAIL